MIRADVHLLRREFSLDVNFDFDTRAVGVFGPSGAGKTTLMNIIAGLERPDRGSIAIGDRRLFDSTAGLDVPAHRRRVGVVFQEPRLFPNYSIHGNLRYSAYRDDDRFDAIADLLELGTLLRRRVHELSGGERHRVALGRALLSRPQLLLLDEPFASLDHRLRQQIIPYLCRIRDTLDIPMLFVSHDLTEILQLTDRVLVMDRGHIAGFGRYTDILHHQAVLDVVHDRGLNNVLAAVVLEHHPSEGVSELRLVSSPGQENGLTSTISAPLMAEPRGARVTVSIQPWDIALALQPVTGVSIQNQIHGVVQHVTSAERGVFVEINIGLPLIVEVSRRAVDSLELRPGRSLVCLIKSHAFRYVGAGTGP